MNIKQFAKFFTAAATIAISTSAMAGQNDITFKTGFGTSTIQSYSWGATNTIATSSGGGAGVGKVVPQAMQITRVVDAQSPQFLNAVSTGLHQACMELTDGAIKITLHDVTVDSYLVNGASGKQTPTVEQLSLTYGSFDYGVGGVTRGTGTPCQ